MSKHTQNFYSVFKSEGINMNMPWSFPKPVLLNARNKLLRMLEIYPTSIAI